MDHTMFAAEVDRARRRSAEFRRMYDGGDFAPMVVTELFAELSRCIADLRAAERVLRERLEASHLLLLDLAAERRRLRDLLLRAPLAYVITCRRGGIEYVNVAAGALLRAAPRALIGRPLAEFARDPTVVYAALGGEAAPSGAAETWMISAAKTREFPCALWWAGDGAGGFLWALSDRTDRHSAGQLSGLRQRNEQRDEFVAMLAHELRNPVAAALAAASLLDDDRAGPARKRRAIGLIERQSRAAVRLLDDALDAAGVGLDELRIAPVALPVNEVIDLTVVAALEQLDAVLERTGHQVSVVLPERSDRYTMDVDVERLQQLIVNLVDNAIKFTPLGRKIELRVERGERALALVVRDEGIGMNEAQRALALLPFEQAGREGSGGMGIGLALCRAIAQAHGGSLAIESAGPDRGTDVRVTLPMRSRAVTAAAREVPPTVAPYRPRRILVVDDDPDSAQAMSMALELAGHDTIIAHDGIGAVSRVADDPPDAAFVDFRLPDISGVELARALRELRPDMRIVGLTGYAGATDLPMPAVFDCWLLKPIGLDELEAALEHGAVAHPSTPG